MATAGVIQLFKEVTEIFLALQEFQILAVAGVRLFIDVKAPTMHLSWPSLMVARCSVVTAGRPCLSGMLTFSQRLLPTDLHLCFIGRTGSLSHPRGQRRLRKLE